MHPYDTLVYCSSRLTANKWTRAKRASVSMDKGFYIPVRSSVNLTITYTTITKYLVYKKCDLVIRYIVYDQLLLLSKVVRTVCYRKSNYVRR